MKPQGVFFDHAPKYWQVGLPVFPLKTREKMPAIGGWQYYGNRMPTAEEQEHWLHSYPTGNIGLAPGSASGLCFLDIDSDDPAVARAIARVIPNGSPWIRKGSKGAMLAFKHTGLRSFKIMGVQSTGENAARARPILEFLSKSGQTVVVPSIHPTTQRPYTENVSLIDVFKIVPELPADVEVRLRDALILEGVNVNTDGSAKVSQFTPAGARDNAMVSNAGILAMSITRGERNLVEALGQMKVWVETYTEKVAGDELSVDKAQQKVIEFLIRDVTGAHRRGLPDGWDVGLSDVDKKAMGLEFGSDHEIWSSERLKTWLDAEFTRVGKTDSPEWQNVLTLALSHLARNNSMSVVESEGILKYMVAVSAGAVGMGTLRKGLARAKQGAIEGNNHNEIAVALADDLAQLGEVRHHNGFLWQWKGAHWDRLDDIFVLDVISKQYGEFQACRKEPDHRAVLRCLKTKLNKELDVAKIKGLNFANGFLTPDLQLLPHNPDFGCVYVLGHRYIADLAGHFPLFQQFLRDCWGKDPDFEDKVLALQEAMACTLFGQGTAYERCICLFGEARSGKTRMIEMMKGLLPPRCTSVVLPEDFDDRFKITMLYNSIMNIGGELSESKLISGARLKDIVSGGEQNGQYKGQPIFVFNPIATHWFAGNNLPKSKDSTDGFTRRWLILRFDHKVREEDKVIGIEKIILAHETEAIAAWAAQGITRLVANKGFTLPASHHIYLEQLHNSTNSVRYFLTNCNDILVGAAKVAARKIQHVAEEQLYSAYQVFCQITMGGRPLSRQKFYELMQGLAGEMQFHQDTFKDAEGHTHTNYRGIAALK